jgi:prohibitin 2
VTDVKAVHIDPRDYRLDGRLMRRIWRLGKPYWFNRAHWKSWVLMIFGILLALVFLLVLLLPRMIVQIPAGHVGVLWLRFFGGTVTDFHFDEGVRIIFPWDEVYIYDARLRTSARTYDTISSNGLSMQVEIAVRYRVNRDSVGALHRLIGPSYPEILVYPEIGSHARELISRYTPEQLYTETRAFIQAQILERMVTQLGSSLIAQGLAGRLVFVEDVLIRSVVLPASVVEAIERKVEIAAQHGRAFDNRHLAIL